MSAGPTSPIIELACQVMVWDPDTTILSLMPLQNLIWCHWNRLELVRVPNEMESLNYLHFSPLSNIYVAVQTSLGLFGFVFYSLSIGMLCRMPNGDNILFTFFSGWLKFNCFTPKKPAKWFPVIINLINQKFTFLWKYVL